MRDEKKECLTPDELCGIFNQEEDHGAFELDLEAAKEERAEEIRKKPLF